VQKRLHHSASTVYRKQERSLFTVALEQTSNVPTAIIRPRPTAGLWSPIPSIRSAIASLRRAAHLLFDRCATAPETRPLPAVSRTYPARDVDRLSSGVRRGGGGHSPARRPGADGRCTSPVALPRTLPRPFWAHHCRPMLIIRRRRWSSVIGREWRLVRPVTLPARPAGDPTLIMQVIILVRTYVLGRNRLPVSHFPNRFPVFRFPFNIPSYG